MDDYLVPYKPSSKPLKLGKRPVKQTVAQAVAPLLSDGGEDEPDFDPFSGRLAKVNAALMKTLGQEDSAITNSTAYSRATHVESCATGHQSGEGPTGKRRRDERNGKLSFQKKDSESEILKGCVCYISGYTGSDIPNPVLKELIERLGGQASYTSCNSSTTHVFAPNLSASKAEMLLKRNKKNHAKFVTPDWVIDSAKRGKRVNEANYSGRLLNEQGRLPSPPNAQPSSPSFQPALSPRMLPHESTSSSSPPRAVKKRTRSRAEASTTATSDLLAVVARIRSSDVEETKLDQVQKRPAVDVECGDSSFSTALGAKRRRKHRAEVVETVVIDDDETEEKEEVAEVEEESEDEWAMPPSSQRR